MQDLRFVVAGAYVADCFVNVSHLPAWGEDSRAQGIRVTPGGKALNQAVALARLGCQVTAVGVVGEDHSGREILETLTREGVDISGIQSADSAATPVCICFVGDEGQTSFVWHIDDLAAVTPDVIRGASEVIHRADALLATFEMPAAAVHEAIWTASRNGTRIIIQPAPSLPDPGAAVSLPWEKVDIIVPNEAEARALLDAATGGQCCIPAEELALALADELGTRTVVVTLAERGCVAHLAGTAHSFPAEGTTPVDTSGASDAFTATLAAQMAAGTRESAAIRAAQSAAAWAIRHRGGCDAMPYVDAAGRLTSAAHSAKRRSGTDDVGHG